MNFPTSLCLRGQKAADETGLQHSLPDVGLCRGIDQNLSLGECRYWCLAKIQGWRGISPLLPYPAKNKLRK